MNRNTAPKPPVVAEPDELSPVAVEQLFGDIRAFIEEARSQVARAVNVGLVSLYWRVGSRIHEDILQHERAGYGEQIVATLSRQLTERYGAGFSAKSLFHMVRFSQAFPEEQIVSAVPRQLTWSHYLEIIYLEDPLQREFYTEVCRVERWSTRTLRSKIRGMLRAQSAWLSTSPSCRRGLCSRHGCVRPSDWLVPRLPRVLSARRENRRLEPGREKAEHQRSDPHDSHSERHRLPHLVPAHPEGRRGGGWREDRRRPADGRRGPGRFRRRGVHRR